MKVVILADVLGSNSGLRFGARTYQFGEELDITYGGLEVHLKDCGILRQFRRDYYGNEILFWATYILSIT